LSEDFRPGSLSLDRAIEKVRDEIDRRMADDFSAYAAGEGIDVPPRDTSG
jgi:hypothetical protein